MHWGDELAALADAEHGACTFTSSVVFSAWLKHHSGGSTFPVVQCIT